MKGKRYISRLEFVFFFNNQIILFFEDRGMADLHSFIKWNTLSKPKCRFIFKQILHSVKSCHLQSIAHRDLKTKNIIINKSSEIQLIDFGFSVKIKSSKLIADFSGTPLYLAPEIVLGKKYNRKNYDFARFWEKIKNFKTAGILFLKLLILIKFA